MLREVLHVLVLRVGDGNKDVKDVGIMRVIHTLDVEL